MIIRCHKQTVIRTMWKKEVNGDLSLSPHHMIAYVMYQFRIKIKSRVKEIVFVEIEWKVDECNTIAVNLEWHLDVCGSGFCTTVKDLSLQPS